MSPSNHALLRQSMPLARQWAQSLCHHVDKSGASCASFHEIWQILRYLDLNASADAHDDFFLDHMAMAIGAGAKRVLISGAADYAMLDAVRRAFLEAPVPPEVTVVDVCETPLRLCQWYADKMDMQIAVQRSDILTFTDENPFDLICTHAFLSYFDKAGRRELAARWHSLLAPGGRLMSVNRLRPSAPEEVSFTDVEARAFTDDVCQRLAKSDLASDVTLKDFTTLADRYIRTRFLYPVRSEAEIVALLTGTGFEMVYMTPDPMTCDQPGQPSGPTLRGGARYACFVARRPA